MKPILVVDDDEIVVSMVSAILRRGGYEVRTAGDGSEALGVITKESIGIVISDWDMPKMDGITLCRAIRSHSGDGYIYVILLTSQTKKEQRVAGLAAGADDFLSKPFDPAELIERVRVAERILQLETRDALIFAMAKLAESRDPETGQHLERVQRFSAILCRELAIDSPYSDQISAEFMRLIYQTSPLHDIGKVGIPDAVLQKPGKLTDDEFEIMKRHTEIGAEAIRETLKHAPSAKYLQMAMEIAISHHEKFDGSGYPRALKGSAIPLSGRIIALVDVYDALTTKRVYKPAFPHAKALDIISDGAGSHFDPVIVQAFLRAEAEFDLVRVLMAEDGERSPTAGTLSPTLTNASTGHPSEAIATPTTGAPHTC